MIFQEPMTALNPLRTIGDQIAEMFRIHTDLARGRDDARVLELLREVRHSRSRRCSRGPIRTSCPAASASGR